eukprot:277516_1
MEGVLFTNPVVAILSKIFGIICLIIIAAIILTFALTLIQNVYTILHKKKLSTRPYMFIFYYSWIADIFIITGMYWWVIRGLCVYIIEPHSFYFFFIWFWVWTGHIIAEFWRLVCNINTKCLCHWNIDCYRCYGPYIWNRKHNTLYLERKLWRNNNSYCKYLLCFPLDHFLRYGMFIIFGTMFFIMYQDIGDYQIHWYDYYPILILLIIKMLLQIWYTFGDTYDYKAEIALKYDIKLLKILTNKFNEDVTKII